MCGSPFRPETTGRPRLGLHKKWLQLGLGVECKRTDHELNIANVY